MAGVGTDPGWGAASLAKTVPSPLLSFHAPAPSRVWSCARRRCAAAPQGLGLALAGPLPSVAGVSERSAARLSFPSGFSYVHPAPSPQPGTCSRRRPSADGRDLIPPAAQLGCSLIAPGRRPLALLSAAGPGPGKGSGAPNRPGQFSLFLFSPFLWFWGRTEGKGGGLEPKRQGAAAAERPGQGGGEASSALSSSAWSTVCSWLSDDL